MKRWYFVFFLHSGRFIPEIRVSDDPHYYYHYYMPDVGMQGRCATLLLDNEKILVCPDGL